MLGSGTADCVPATAGFCGRDCSLFRLPFLEELGRPAFTPGGGRQLQRSLPPRSRNPQYAPCFWQPSFSSSLNRFVQALFESTQRGVQAVHQSRNSSLASLMVLPFPYSVNRCVLPDQNLLKLSKICHLVTLLNSASFAAISHVGMPRSCTVVVLMTLPSVYDGV